MKGPPQKLYRYFNFQSEHTWCNLKDIILHNRIRFSGIEELNDPFDCRPMLMTSDSAIHTRFEALISEIRKTSGVLSLTTKNDNILMWGYSLIQRAFRGELL